MQLQLKIAKEKAAAVDCVANSESDECDGDDLISDTELKAILEERSIDVDEEKLGSYLGEVEDMEELNKTTKDDKPLCEAHYRHISILPALSNVFEPLVLR